MTARAILVHHIAGRTRFRIPDKRGDTAYLAGVSEQLRHCPGVTSVTSSATTGSVLVVHETADADVLLAYARTLDLFEVLERPAAAVEKNRAPAEIVNDSLQRVDDWVRAETGLRTDLRSLALTGLIGAAVWQMLRGQLLPAAGTLIWYALSVAAEGRQRSSGIERATPNADHEEVDSPAV
jgi:hypothetical protein